MALIVVIDSEEIVRSVVSAILKKAGYQVRAFGDFASALGEVRTSQPSLVLTNVFLRGITGHDAMLKLHSEFPELPVLMVSGLPDEDVIHNWTNKSKFDVFPKPFRAQQLVAKVREMIP